jgi:hypothetical protein
VEYSVELYRSLIERMGSCTFIIQKTELQVATMFGKR